MKTTHRGQNPEIDYYWFSKVLLVVMLMQSWLSEEFRDQLKMLVSSEWTVQLVISQIREIIIISQDQLLQSIDDLSLFFTPLKYHYPEPHWYGWWLEILQIRLEHRQPFLNNCFRQVSHQKLNKKYLTYYNIYLDTWLCLQRFCTTLPILSKYFWFLFYIVQVSIKTTKLTSDTNNKHRLLEPR